MEQRPNRHLRHALGWLIIASLIGLLETEQGRSAYDAILRGTDAAAVQRLREDSARAVEQARGEASARGDSVTAVVFSPPTPGRTARSLRDEVRIIVLVGLPIASLGIALSLSAYGRASRRNNS